MKINLSFILSAFGMLVTSFIFCGCNEDYLSPFKSHPPAPAERFALSMEYNNKHGYADIRVPNEQYNIYVCTDTHIASSNTTFARFVELYRNDIHCPVACCLGDLVEATYPYDIFVSAINETPANPEKSDTLFVTPGNHDLFFKQWESFIRIWKTSVYYFTVSCPNGIKDLYICLDSAHATLGRKQLAWLVKTLQDSQTNTYRHTIVYTHVNIFRRDNTYNDISTFALEESEELMALFSTYQVEQVWMGHDHGRDIFCQGGVKYILVDSFMDNKTGSYMVLHVGEHLYNTFHLISDAQ